MFVVLGTHAEQSPYTLAPIADPELPVAVGEGEYVRYSPTSLYGAAESFVDKLVGFAVEFYCSWIRSHVTAEAHACDVDLLIDVMCVHCFTPDSSSCKKKG